MNDTLFETALIRVKAGESMTAVIVALYKRRHEYRLSTTPEQRARLKATREEYKTAKREHASERHPRLFFYTTAERRKAVLLHCQQNGITVARFLNSVIAEALRLSKEDS